MRPSAPCLRCALPSTANLTTARRSAQVDFEILGDLTYEDLKEMGVSEVGPRRKIFRAITAWREERDYKKAEAIRTQMARREPEATPRDPQAQRLAEIRYSLSAGAPP